MADGLHLHQKIQLLSMSVMEIFFHGKSRVGTFLTYANTASVTYLNCGSSAIVLVFATLVHYHFLI